MIMRRFDRYLLREMVGPFLISIAGLFLFILLNLILSLSGLLVDRGVGAAAMFRLLVFKTPSMLVIALPVSALFATFLGLGRLVHDREIMALEASGVSLRRILVPLIVAAFLLGVGDFVLYNWAVPPAEHAYQMQLRSIIFRSSTPHIRTNTFFTGPQGVFFYVRRYDEADKSLHDVLVYDTSGRLFPQANAAVTILTAAQGRWTDDTWNLTDGRVYGYNSDGTLIYTGKFNQLRVSTGPAGTAALLSSRTPAEMSIGELRQRIALLRKSGLPVNDLVVECNLKGAIPLAAAVFVLFGGATSLLFAWRSRAVGIVIGFLLVGLFQGTLLWTQTLGRRGLLPAPLAAWIPDIVFGAVGIIMLFRLDRLRRHDWRTWIRRVFPFLAIVLVIGFTAVGKSPPVAITCDKLFIAADNSRVTATGSVHLSYEKTDLTADQVKLVKAADGSWTLTAAGNVTIAVGDGFSLTGDRLTAVLTPHDTGVTTTAASATAFHGQSEFVNSKGEKHVLIYRAADGKISFDAAGDVSAIEMTDGTLSTCDCCGDTVSAQPYAIHTGKLILYPDKLIVAFNLSVTSFGMPVFWLPVYVQPLKQTLDSPLFPAIGRSAVRGFFLKWNFPYYLDRGNYGTILFDYFNRFHEIGLGAVVHYALAGIAGTARVYFFPARVGDSITEVSLAPSISLPGGGRAGGSMSYRRVGTRRDLSFSFSGTQPLGAWKLTVSAARTTTTTNTVTRTVQRLPQISIARAHIPVGPIAVTTHASVGWFTEQDNDSPLHASFRADVGIDIEPVSALKLSVFTVTPRAGIELTRYVASTTQEKRDMAYFSIAASSSALSLSYTYRRVHGESPFNFDRLTTTNHLTWRVGKPGAATIAGGVDLEHARFDPTTMTITRSPFTLTASYDINTAALTKVVLQGSWHGKDYSTAVTVPYLPAVNRWDKITFSATRTHAGNRIAVGGTFDPHTNGLTGKLTAAVITPSGWGFNVSGGYDPGIGIINPGFGLFYEFYHCLRVGVERKAGQVWLYASILAFPEAVLRYAPTGAGVQVGTH